MFTSILTMKAINGDRWFSECLRVWDSSFKFINWVLFSSCLVYLIDLLTEMLAVQIQLFLLGSEQGMFRT